MPYTPIRILLLSLCALAGTATFLRAQSNVSGALAGRITGEAGGALVGATVILEQAATNVRHESTSNAAGRYQFGGLAVGDGYTLTVSAPGYQEGRVEGLLIRLGETEVLDLSLSAEGTVQLETVVVRADPWELDAGESGSRTLFGSEDLLSLPTADRSFADVVRRDPTVVLRSTLALREQPVLSAVGQNNRFNSVEVDGARINDPFGLNGSGFQSFGNPISLEGLEQIDVAVAPYDAGMSGFTGASINAVTRSGTNQFSGSTYYLYSDQDLQGADVFGSGEGTRAALRRKTWGLNFGGPLVRDHLFFFVNHERFSNLTSDVATVDPTGTTAGSSDLSRVLARIDALNTAAGDDLGFGNFAGRTAPVKQDDTKWLAKLDWVPVSSQRLSVRYTRVKGELPATGKFSQTSVLNPVTTFGGFNVATNQVAGLDSNAYNQRRDEESWAGQLFSQWSPALQTELHYSEGSYTQETPVASVLPEIRIFGFSGLNRSGTAVAGNGVLVLGTEVNRQGNFVGVDTREIRASATYRWRDVTLQAGYDREQSDFVNLFRMGSYGVFDYANVTDFENDAVRNFARSTYLEGTSPDERSDFAVNGVYAQADWSVSPRLNVGAGLRYDWFTAGARPPLNAASNPDAATDFLGIFGIRNDGTIDGANAVSPRVSFNLALDAERRSQLRGGLGHFVGRIPWVIVSNSFGNSGVGRSAVFAVGPTAPRLETYLTAPENPAQPQLTFDPDNPIGRSTSTFVGQPSINLVRDGIQPPAVWRGNLAFDQRVDFADSTVTLEVVGTRASEALYIRDLNLKPRFVGSDGRQVFSGSPSNPGGFSALHPQFASVHEISNISEGSSTYLSLSLRGGRTDVWEYAAALTVGDASDAMPLGEAVAAAQFSRNPVFNQNTPEVTRSAFEVERRIQFSLSRVFGFWPGAPTTLSLYYEGRTGNPYSYTYANDANGDGSSGNDLIYVPTGMSDPVITASIANGMPMAVAQQYVDFVQNGELAPYAGGIAPRHAFLEPWVNRLDLHVAQEIPLYRPAQFELFADFINLGSWLSKDLFGYRETIAGQGDTEVFTISRFGTATYLPSGQLVMTGATYFDPESPKPDNQQSRWRIQLGGRLRF